MILAIYPQSSLAVLKVEDPLEVPREALISKTNHPEYWKLVCYVEKRQLLTVSETKWSTLDFAGSTHPAVRPQLDVHGATGGQVVKWEFQIERSRLEDHEVGTEIQVSHDVEHLEGEILRQLQAVSLYTISRWLSQHRRENWPGLGKHNTQVIRNRARIGWQEDIGSILRVECLSNTIHKKVDYTSIGPNRTCTRTEELRGQVYEW